MFFFFALLFPHGAAAKAEKDADIGYDPTVSSYYTGEGQTVLSSAPETGCRAVYIADPESGKVFYEKNAHKRMYPASTTKLLTALLVLENSSLSQKTTVSQRAIDLVPPDYVTANLQAGEEIDIETLLYLLLLPSANDAANVLAEFVGGSVEAFAELCNQRAKELGCENLHFVNPNGVQSEDHYCTAYDLYLIAKECRKYGIFNTIVSTKSFSLPADEIYTENDRKFVNTNEMLFSGAYYYEYCTGIKTGRTNPAGECFVGSASKDGINLISVVLGGKAENSRGLNDRFDDTKKLFSFFYKNYSVKTVAEKGEAFFSVRVPDATADTSSLDLVLAADVSALIPNSLSSDEIRFSISVKKDICAPLRKGQRLGEIVFYADGTVCKADLVAKHAVKKINREYRYLYWNTDFLWQ